MKNFKSFLIAAVAIIAGVAISSCTPEPVGPEKVTTKANVEVAELTPNGATIKVLTQNISEFAYMLDKDVPTSAILQAGEKTTIAEPAVEKVTDVVIRNLEPNSTHTLYFAFRKADGILYENKEVVEFTTTTYGDNVITVVDRRYDGFAVHVQVPAEVKERGNALRYSTTSLPMYNYSKSMGSLEMDMLLYNAGQYTTEDKTIRFDEYNSYERDEEGNIIENGAEYADPKVPGEPGVFLIGEYGYMDDPDEMVVYMDGEVKTVSISEDDPDYIKYAERAIWAYPAGWKAGYYMPMYDWMSWITEMVSDSYDPEKYWNGYYEKVYIDTLEPEDLDANVDIKVTDLTPVEACISFTPSDNIAQYCILICTESEYQNDFLPLIDNNEKYLRWFTGSYFAMMTIGIEMAQGPTELWLTDWFADTKGMAGQTIRILVSALGDNEGKSQYFTTTTFTMPEVTLPKPEVVITPVPSDNPYVATFNIKNPNYETNKIAEAYFACNYIREFNQILKEYSYTELLKTMGNPLHYDQTAIEQINSAKGYDFVISSRDAATTRLAMLVYNWEGTGNNPDAKDTQAVAEYTTPNAHFPARVNSELFTKLLGEWEAEAPMVSFEAVTDDQGNATGEYTKKSAGNYTSPVTISAGVEYPATLPEEIYELYASMGVSREKTDEYWAEFKSLADMYNARTRGFNRLLCMGYNFAAKDFMLDVTATPYELFTAKDYSSSTTADMFYDFGPKWNLEIDAEGNVWLPIDIEREFPLEAFNFGLDYTFYMLAVGEKSYMGAPVYNQQGKLVCDSRFPVEISDDYNTITIKPIVYNYTDSNGQPAVETYYPCVAQLQYGMATPLNPRVAGDVVLKRKGASAQAAKANASVGRGAEQNIQSLGEAPVPMQRTHSMTPLTDAKHIKRIVREEKVEAGSEAFRRRADDLMYKTFGIKRQ
jgi:hypothetical protein